jgi:predicted Ser/Thr protein kinase
MSPERFQRIEELYHAARVGTLEERAALLAQAEPELRRQVESLLAQPSGGEFLDRPAFQNATDLLEDSTVAGLAAGTRLGPYQVESKIGAGGMGEVYRALDTRLRRKVALKVSQERFSDRFEREARAVAALNHPHICQIYDVGPNYLVMELVEGESPKGPLPLEKALTYARQIAEALEAAHEKGIVHRDLKPANIKITPEGQVKVLDFGLAKQVPGAGQPYNPENSPTLTYSATQAGVILGTAAYMSPEQARGKNVDRRADIWAFGVVLYELLVGERPFHGEDLTETLASVVKEPPDLSKAPVKVRRLIESCLEKDPRKRLRDIGDAWRLLEEPPAAAKPAAVGPWVAASLVAGAVLGVAGWMALQRAGAGAPDGWKLSVVPPPGAELPPVGSLYQATPEISPDGTMTVCRLGEGLQLRRLDSTQFIPLKGTKDAVQPFWSPDSQWIGFFANGGLMKIRVPDGSPELLAKIGRFPRGGTWGSSGTIQYLEAGLKTISAAGGTAALLPIPARLHGGQFPHFLPDGEHFLFLGRPSPPEGGPPGVNLYLGGSSGSKLTMQPVLLKANCGESRYWPAEGGSILFVHSDNLYSQKLNLAQARLEGSPLLVESSVATSGSNGGTSDFSISAGGMVAWRPGHAYGEQLTWFDRHGNAVGTAGTPTVYQECRLSPDEHRIAAIVHLADRMELRILETWQSGFLTIPNRESNFAQFQGVIWRPDSIHLLAAWNTFGAGTSLKEHSTIGNSETHDLGNMSGYLHSVAPDGTILGTFQSTLHVTRLEGDRTPQALVASGQQTGQGAFSPDGHWVVYASGAAQELFVQAFPISGPRKQLSTGGGWMPCWRADGRELVYLGPDSFVYSVRFDPARGEFHPPERLFAVRSSPNSTEHFNLAVTRDGSRILFAQAIDQPESRVINVALHR